MIGFSCQKCGQKVSAPDVQAGKKGRCPKCRAIVQIPAITDDDISLRPLESDVDRSELLSKEPEEEFHLRRETSGQAKFEGLSADGLIVTNETIPKSKTKEEPPRRKLPASIDVFLYPTSLSGLINILIFCVLSFLLTIFSIFAGPICFVRMGILLLAAGTLGYMLYYMIECVRDSASGGIRAPDNLGSLPTTGEAFSQLWETFLSIAILWGPLLAYYGFRFFSQTGGEDSDYSPNADVVFWLLLWYGVFFSPIAFLALAVFGSTSAYNPLLWLSSVFSTLVPYCGLVLLLSAFGFVLSRIAAALGNGLVNILLSTGILLYFAMIAAHLLGRFYYIYSEKLNWEV